MKKPKMKKRKLKKNVNRVNLIYETSNSICNFQKFHTIGSFIANNFTKKYSLNDADDCQKLFIN